MYEWICLLLIIPFTTYSYQRWSCLLHGANTPKAGADLMRNIQRRNPVFQDKSTQMRIDSSISSITTFLCRFLNQLLYTLNPPTTSISQVYY